MIKFLKNIFNRTKFHTKLIITYSLIVMLILIILSLLSVSYARILLENSVKKDFTQTAVTLQQKINYAFSEMDSVCDIIKQNEDIQNQLIKFQDEENQVGNRFTYKMWLKKFLLDAVNINSEIYRVSVFNDKGDFLSTNEFSFMTDAQITHIKESEWYQEIQEGADEVILSPHYDNWLDNKHISVYSIVKPIKKYDEILGYVEIQRRVNEYSQITAGVDNDALIAIIDTDGKVFYSNRKLFSKKLINHYLELSETENTINLAPNIFSNIQEMIAHVKSDKGWTIIVVQNYNNIFKPAQSVKNIVFMAAFALMAISFVFVYIFSKRLTVPLRKLKGNIEKVTISNLNKPKDVADNFEHDEIEAIHDSFLDMQKRLKESMELEIRSCSMQAKAHFDALQARINPHFIYNMLGIIVNMAEEAEQYDIGDVCRRLAKMLRYTTQASDSLSIIKEEIAHVEDYLLLMKSRFEHRLSYRIDVDKSMYNIIVPKFLIQPLIENSLSHGFKNSPVEVMQIQIVGKLTAYDCWELQIMDNGSGFKEDTLSSLNDRIQDYKEKVLKHQKPEELSIGGMGVINTFVRLGLYFGDKAEFDIRNMEQGGALLIIKGPIEYEGRE